MAQSKYDTHVKDKLILVEGWARDGLTEEQIARNLGISYSTFKDYKNKHSALLTALKKGKEVVDYEVENALYKAAINGNVTAMIFWLKNRKPNVWRDKQEIEHSGNVNNPFGGLTTDELRELINNGEAN